MSGNLTRQGQERGCDTMYRASKSDTHLTHGCIQLFRHSHGGRCARAVCHRLPTLAFPRIMKRADSALREVST